MFHAVCSSTVKTGFVKPGNSDSSSGEKMESVSHQFDQK